MLSILLILLGGLAIWSGAVLADLAITSKHFTDVDRCLFLVGSTIGFFIGLEMLIASFRDR